ncbi:hypothetical protein BACCIP111899_04229 [Bacillus rhizoplanae]|uniref:Uncharacterized protein n=2 Tax=Bacillus TaxID=1386 RepID=A0ABM8YH37_9BACI|nr:DUF6454 family protein [Bacillus rhizoplanae]CAG9614995.1 hypothetical protein BACCIP111899_04229 [Bacillus rhizoplanae]
MKKVIFALAAVLAIGTATTAFAQNDTLNSDKEGKQLTEKFQQLTRNNVWEQKEKVDLQFNTYHPQGMTKVGDLYYMSSVEIIEKPVKYDQPKDGFDRTPGKGIGHLFVFNKEGKLLKDLKLGEGDMYHPGGIAFDGTSIWVPIAEYRPNSQSIIYKVNPETLNAQEVFRTNDHIGGIVRNEKGGALKAVSWGSRTFYEFNEKGKVLQKSNNTSHFIDYQDCENVGENNMICSGITELPGSSTAKYELGGLALLDMKTMDTVHELPIPLFSPQGHVVTRNPVFLENTKQGIKMYAVPDDDQSNMLVYETNISKK